MRLTIDDYLDRITPDSQGCKIWDGKHMKIGPRSRRSPMFRDTPSTWISARRAVWENQTGDILSDSDRVITTCGRDLCVSFDHLAIADMRTVVLQRRDWKCMKGLHDMRNPSNRAPGGNGHDICRACKNARLRAWRAGRK